MRLLTLALLLTFPIGLPATTLFVDGPGDGDTDGTDDFDSIREALMDLGASGLGTDGASDEICVVVDSIHEDARPVINGRQAAIIGFEPVRDDLTIEGDADGNGVRCVVDIIPDGEALMVMPADAQDIVLRDLILILTYGHSAVGSFMRVWGQEGTPPFIGASLTLEGVMITASLEGNVPRSPDDFTSGGSMFWNDYEAAGIHVWESENGLPVDFRIIDCVVAHQHTSGMILHTETGSFEIADTRVVNNGWAFNRYLWLGEGIVLSTEATAEATLSNVRVERNLVRQLLLHSPPNPAAEFDVMIGPGCRFLGGAKRSVGAGGEAYPGRLNIRIAGSCEDPVIVEGSSVSINTGISNVSLIASHLIVANASRTLWLTGDPIREGFDAVITDSLFVNGMPEYEDLLNPYSDNEQGRLVGIEEDVSVQFERCTFHNADPNTDLGPEANLVEFTDSYNTPPFTPQQVFVDCIFSGDGDEVALIPGDLASPELSHCAIATTGPHAVSEEWAAGSAIVTQGCVFIDPIYVQTDDPSAPGYFDVWNPALRSAGSDGGPLSGWGDYVGPTGEEHGLILR